MTELPGDVPALRSFLCKPFKLKFRFSSTSVVYLTSNGLSIYSFIVINFLLQSANVTIKRLPSHTESITEIDQSQASIHLRGGLGSRL